MEVRHIQHLYNRAGFGILPEKLQTLKTKSQVTIVNELFDKSRRARPLQMDNSEFLDINPEHIRNDQEAKEALRKRLKEKLVELNTNWMERLRTTDQLLREKMTLFWANHFVCQDNNAVFAEHFNNTLREHALGNFRYFVKAVSREASMIKYLNLNQNRKQHPNENFARELMELFMLGKDHYSESDIKESARAFTGYSHNFHGEFYFRRDLHDFDEKTFFKRKGHFQGDDIIDIMLLEQQCARFVCEKIYRYFVNDTINKAHIDEMVAQFYPRYDIEELMHHVFMSDWFYDDINIGSKIKSPVEFLVGIHKLVPLNFKRPKQLIAIQKLLGQVLLNPPNVAGWPGGKNWIDSNTIFLRLRLPSILLNQAYIPLKRPGDFDDRFAKFIKRELKGVTLFEVDHDWTEFEKNFKNVALNDVHSYVLQTDFYKGTGSFVQNLVKTTKKDYCLQLMSLPEYQMC